MAGEAIGLLLTVAVLVPGCPVPCEDATPPQTAADLVPGLDELPLDDPTDAPPGLIDGPPVAGLGVGDLAPFELLLDQALPGPGPSPSSLSTGTTWRLADGHGRAADPLQLEHGAADEPGDAPTVDGHPIPALARQPQARPHAVDQAPGVHAAEQASLPPATAAGLLVALAAIGLYHRLTKRELLTHDSRRRILELLEEQPGRGTPEIAEALGCCYRTARHHLGKLAAFDLVTGQRLGHRTVWSLPSDAKQARQRLDGHASAILETLTEEPGLHLSRLARELSLSKATVKHHLDRLVERGLVEDERIGPLRCFRTVEDGS